MSTATSPAIPRPKARRRPGLCPLASREAMPPRSEFLDTCYHLTEEAAARRTGRLLGHLALQLPASESGAQ
jgi:hypothetical protein